MRNFPRKSGKQAGRLLLPAFLRDASSEILRMEYAIGVGRPEAACAPGEDADDRVLALVSEATPELRQKCRALVLSYTLAPHAKWAPEPTEDATEAKATGPTVDELEAHLRELAESGDRAAILAMLAALDPARYGPPGRTVADSPDTVDVVDWVPAVVTTADRK
jgi:hypothetical protein